MNAQENLDRLFRELRDALQNGRGDAAALALELSNNLQGYATKGMGYKMGARAMVNSYKGFIDTRVLTALRVAVDFAE